MSWREFEYVRTELRDGVASVRIGDPNDDDFVARRHPMHGELRDVFQLLDADSDVAAIALLGGQRSFCPPPDLANLDALLSADAGAAERLQAEARDIVLNLLAVEKPVVAGVAGPATGMGTQLALLCDFIVAAPAARFEDSHVRLGLTAGDGGTLIWPLVVGLARARDVLLGGASIDAVTAERLGLIKELVADPEAAEAGTVGLAAELGSLPAEAYATTKRSLNGWLRLAVSETLIPASEAQVGSYESEPFRALRKARKGERG
jgi:enoyl-CoA hydratase